MGIIEDIISALERIPIWKRVSALPAEVQALRERIEALEKRLAGGSGQRCPVCNSTDFKVTGSAPDADFSFAGVMRDTYRCKDCGHQESRPRQTRT
jgi:transposase-like protein